MVGPPRCARTRRGEAAAAASLRRRVDRESETSSPVVVSDGHTYERDAIMRHFVNSGFVSPLTRQRVAPYVFINRAGVFAD